MKMNSINNIEELRSEIHRLKDLKKVQKEIILKDWNQISSFFSAVYQVSSVIKTFLNFKVGGNIWLNIVSFLLKEIKDKQIFSSGFNGFLDIFTGFFKRKA